MGTWTFTDLRGLAAWPNGGAARLGVERFDSGGVIIYRTDLPGSLGDGITARYEGVMHGDHIDGKFTWRRGGGGEQGGAWHARIVTGEEQRSYRQAQQAILARLPGPPPSVQSAADLSRQLPPLMHFCGANCMTLERQEDHYVRTRQLPWEPPTTRSVWAIDVFAPDSVIIRRHEWDSAKPGDKGWQTIYRGRISPDGNHLVNITDGAIAQPGIRMSWGGALAETPGDNEDRDRRNAAAAAAAPQYKYGSRLADQMMQAANQAAAPPPGATATTQEPALPVPVFLKDVTFNYELDGEWALTFPADWPRHPPVTGIAVVKDQAFQLVTANPNLFYPLGQNFFYGHFTDPRHIEGKWMEAPAHQGDGDRGYAWSDAKIEIQDANSMLSGTGVALKRSSPERGANHLCDSVTYAHLDAAHTFDYAEESAELKNYGNAACWFYVSASQGHSEAQLSLGLLLRFGLGVRKDEKLAFQWIQRSANQGWVLAGRALADCYGSGIGVPKNETQARLWREKSSAETPQIGQVAREQQQWAAFLERFTSALSGRNMDVSERASQLMDCPGGVHCTQAARQEAWERARAEQGAAQYMYDLMNSYHLPPNPDAH